MAANPITGLPAVATLVETDQFAVVNGGSTKRATIKQISTEALVPSYGEIYVTGSIATVIAVVSTPVKMLGTTALSTNFTAQNFSMPANNRLRYDGAPNKVVHVEATITISAATNNKTFQFYVAKNGTVLTESCVQRKIGTSSDIGSVNVQAAMNMSTGDFAEVWVENITDATDITAITLNMFGRGFVVP